MLVVSAAFALAKLVVGNVQFMTFIAFGSFALLVFADFGGTRRSRARAYAIATLVGALLVILGTLASADVWAAVLIALLIGFSIQFVGVFGGYIAASQFALLLAFVLSVSIAAPPDAIGARLAGWCAAGALATLASVLLWSRFERRTLFNQAGAACRSLAAEIRAQRHPAQDAELARDREAARTAVDTVRSAYAATPWRPAGSSRGDRAFVELLGELETTLRFVTRPFQHRLSAGHPRLVEGDALADAVGRTLEASDTVLNGGVAPDLAALPEARNAHRRALDRWAEDALRAGSPPEEVLEGLEVDDTLRVVSCLAQAIGTNAVTAAGGTVDAARDLPIGTPPTPGLAALAAQAAHTVRTYLSPSSSVLHHSLRVALGLALAVLLARVLQLEHAFWVVLATLSVLRSNALATGRTTLQAVTGAIAGFVVGALFIVVVGGASTILWIAFPVTVFLAAYAPSAIGFIVGQAAFTIYVIVLFNLISPAGWQVGLARIEDVAIGTGISVIVGLLLWPAGARHELRRSLAELYRDVAADLGAALGQVLESATPSNIDAVRRRTVRARDRAGQAFDAFLRERGAKPWDPRTAALLVATASHAIMMGDLIGLTGELGYRAQGCNAGVRVLQTQARAMVASFLLLADTLAGATDAAEPNVRVSDDALHGAALTCLRRWNEDASGGISAIAVVAASEWIEQLDALAANLVEPVAATVQATRAARWR